MNNRVGITKPHIYLVDTGWGWGKEWRATMGIHHSVGHSPVVAYRRLMNYIEAQRRQQ